MSDPRENAPDKAARLGMLLVEPNEHELFVDLDGADTVSQFLDRFDNFRKVYKDATVQYTTSKSGNTHAYVTVPDESFTMEQRIALQAALGSDPLREMIAVKHYAGGYKYASVFFEFHDSERRDEPYPCAGAVCAKESTR